MYKFLWATVASVAVSSALASQTTPVPDVRPAANGWQVVINIPQQRLFLYYDGQLEKVYPVAVGKAHTQTLLGEHLIGAKAYNPTWHIPKSIQQERGDGVKTVPPGPKNPLGPVFVRLGDPKHGLGIHGTNAPASVPGIRSHGCVRMKSPDALEFAKKIATGSPATVSYEMAALNVDEAGNLWLAVYKDPYRKNNLNRNALRQTISAWAKANGANIGTARVEQVIKAQAGKAVCLSCTGKAVIQGDLQSLAWNSGSIKPTLPRAGGTRATRNDVMPEGSSIEVDAADDETRPAPPATPRKKTPQRRRIKPTSVFEETPLVPVNKPKAASAPAGERVLQPTNAK
ncbi:L,D-transpeptidase [Conchiformibius kuhniae]|uniref:L,D-transpeptidase n=1 Tax=Conchiformibius kuhniae TaxID=211502 RepID=A0ABD8B6S3_9NEIS|nr:L,D-transpeptidase [Conchiformibius kuhniae]